MQDEEEEKKRGSKRRRNMEQPGVKVVHVTR